MILESNGAHSVVPKSANPTLSNERLISGPQAMSSRQSIYSGTDLQVFALGASGGSLRGAQFFVLPSQETSVVSTMMDNASLILSGKVPGGRKLISNERHSSFSDKYSISTESQLQHSKFYLRRNIFGVETFRLDTSPLGRKALDLTYETENKQVVAEAKRYYQELVTHQKGTSGKYVVVDSDILKYIERDINSSTGKVTIAAAAFSRTTSSEDQDEEGGAGPLHIINNTSFYNALVKKAMAGNLLLSSKHDTNTDALFGKLRDKGAHIAYQANIHYNLYIIEHLGGTDENVLYLTTRRPTGSQERDIAIRISSREDKAAYDFYSKLQKEKFLNFQSIISRDLAYKSMIQKGVDNTQLIPLFDPTSPGLLVPSKMGASYFYARALHNVTMRQAGFNRDVMATGDMGTLAALYRVAIHKTNTLSVPWAVSQFDREVDDGGLGMWLNEHVFMPNGLGRLYRDEVGLLPSLMGALGAALDRTYLYYTDTRTDEAIISHPLKEGDKYGDTKQGLFQTFMSFSTNFALSTASAVSLYLSVGEPLNLLLAEGYREQTQYFLGVATSDDASIPRITKDAARRMTLGWDNWEGMTGTDLKIAAIRRLADLQATHTEFYDVSNFSLTPYHANSALFRRRAHVLMSTLVAPFLVNSVNPFKPGSAESDNFVRAVHNLVEVIGKPVGLEVLSNPKGSLRELADALVTDPSLADRVSLGLTNVGEARQANVAKALQAVLDVTPINPLEWRVFSGLSETPRKPLMIGQLLSLDRATEYMRRIFFGSGSVHQVLNRAQVVGANTASGSAKTLFRLINLGLVESIGRLHKQAELASSLAQQTAVFKKGEAQLVPHTHLTWSPDGTSRLINSMEHGDVLFGAISKYESFLVQGGHSLDDIAGLTARIAESKILQLTQSTASAAAKVSRSAHFDPSLSLSRAKVAMYGLIALDLMLVGNDLAQSTGGASLFTQLAASLTTGAAGLSPEFAASRLLPGSGALALVMGTTYSLGVLGIAHHLARGMQRPVQLSYSFTGEALDAAVDAGTHALYSDADNLLRLGSTEKPVSNLYHLFKLDSEGNLGSSIRLFQKLDIAGNLLRYETVPILNMRGDIARNTAILFGVGILAGQGASQSIAGLLNTTRSFTAGTSAITGGRPHGTLDPLLFGVAGALGGGLTGRRMSAVGLGALIGGALGTATNMLGVRLTDIGAGSSDGAKVDMATGAAVGHLSQFKMLIVDRLRAGHKISKLELMAAFYAGELSKTLPVLQGASPNGSTQVIARQAPLPFLQFFIAQTIKQRKMNPDGSIDPTKQGISTYSVGIQGSALFGVTIDMQLPLKVFKDGTTGTTMFGLAYNEQSNLLDLIHGVASISGTAAMTVVISKAIGASLDRITGQSGIHSVSGFMGKLEGLHAGSLRTLEALPASAFSILRSMALADLEVYGAIAKSAVARYPLASALQEGALAKAIVLRGLIGSFIGSFVGGYATAVINGSDPASIGMGQAAGAVVGALTNVVAPFVLALGKHALNRSSPGSRVTGRLERVSRQVDSIASRSLSPMGTGTYAAEARALDVVSAIDDLEGLQATLANLRLHGNQADVRRIDELSEVVAGTLKKYEAEAGSLHMAPIEVGIGDPIDYEVATTTERVGSNRTVGAIARKGYYITYEDGTRNVLRPVEVMPAGGRAHRSYLRNLNPRRLPMWMKSSIGPLAIFGTLGFLATDPNFGIAKGMDRFGGSSKSDPLYRASVVAAYALPMTAVAYGIGKMGMSVPDTLEAYHAVLTQLDRSNLSLIRRWQLFLTQRALNRDVSYVVETAAKLGTSDPFSKSAGAALKGNLMRVGMGGEYLFDVTTSANRVAIRQLLEESMQLSRAYGTTARRVGPLLFARRSIRTVTPLVIGGGILGALLSRAEGTHKGYTMEPLDYLFDWFESGAHTGNRGLSYVGSVLADAFRLITGMDRSVTKDGPLPNSMGKGTPFGGTPYLIRYQKLIKANQEPFDKILKDLGSLMVVDAQHPYLGFYNLFGFNFRPSEEGGRTNFYLQVQSAGQDISTAVYSMSAAFLFKEALAGRDQLAIDVALSMRDMPHLRRVAANLLSVTSHLMPLTKRRKMSRISDGTLSLLGTDHLIGDVIQDRSRAAASMSFQPSPSLVSRMLQDAMNHKDAARLMAALLSGDKTAIHQLFSDAFGNTTRDLRILSAKFFTYEKPKDKLTATPFLLEDESQWSSVVSPYRLPSEMAGSNNPLAPLTYAVGMVDPILPGPLKVPILLALSLIGGSVLFSTVSVFTLRSQLHGVQQRVDDYLGKPWRTATYEATFLKDATGTRNLSGGRPSIMLRRGSHFMSLNSSLLTGTAAQDRIILKEINQALAQLEAAIHHSYLGELYEGKSFLDHMRSTVNEKLTEIPYQVGSQRAPFIDEVRLTYREQISHLVDNYFAAIEGVTVRVGDRSVPLVSLLIPQLDLNTSTVLPGTLEEAASVAPNLIGAKDKLKEQLFSIVDNVVESEVRGGGLLGSGKLQGSVLHSFEGSVADGIKYLTEKVLHELVGSRVFGLLRTNLGGVAQVLSSDVVSGLEQAVYSMGKVFMQGRFMPGVGQVTTEAAASTVAATAMSSSSRGSRRPLSSLIRGRAGVASTLFHGLQYAGYVLDAFQSFDVFSAYAQLARAQDSPYSTAGDITLARHQVGYVTTNALGSLAVAYGGYVAVPALAEGLAGLLGLGAGAAAASGPPGWAIGLVVAALAVAGIGIAAAWKNVVAPLLGKDNVRGISKGLGNVYYGLSDSVGYLLGEFLPSAGYMVGGTRGKAAVTMAIGTGLGAAGLALGLLGIGAVTLSTVGLFAIGGLALGGVLGLLFPDLAGSMAATASQYLSSLAVGNVPLGSMLLATKPGYAATEDRFQFTNPFSPFTIGTAQQAIETQYKLYLTAAADLTGGQTTLLFTNPSLYGNTVADSPATKVLSRGYSVKPLQFMSDALISREFAMRAQLYNQSIIGRYQWRMMARQAANYWQLVSYERRPEALLVRDFVEALKRVGSVRVQVLAKDTNTLAQLEGSPLLAALADVYAYVQSADSLKYQNYVASLPRQSVTGRTTQASNLHARIQTGMAPTILEEVAANRNGPTIALAKEPSLHNDLISLATQHLLNGAAPSMSMG